MPTSSPVTSTHVEGLSVRHIKAQLDDLAAPLFSLWRDHGQLCVLLNRFRGDPCEAEDAPCDDAGQRPTVFALEHDPLYADAPDSSPALLLLDHGTPGHLAWLDWSVRTAHAQWAASPWRPSICAWLTPAPVAPSALTSPPADLPAVQPVQALQRRLNERLQCYLDPSVSPNIGASNGLLGSHYLRYFDPRVMPRLLQVLRPTERVAFLSPVNDWWQFERDGNWLHLQPPPGSSPRAFSQRFDAAQSRAIGRVQALSRTAQTLADSGLMLPHADNERIDHALVQAQALGLGQEDDQVCFAAHVLLYGEAFTGHAELAQWCEAARAGVPLADRLPSFSS